MPSEQTAVPPRVPVMNEPMIGHEGERRVVCDGAPSVVVTDTKMLHEMGLMS